MTNRKLRDLISDLITKPNPRQAIIEYSIINSMFDGYMTGMSIKSDIDRMDAMDPDKIADIVRPWIMP